MNQVMRAFRGLLVAVLSKKNVRNGCERDYRLHVECANTVARGRKLQMRRARKSNGRKVADCDAGRYRSSNKDSLQVETDDGALSDSDESSVPRREIVSERCMSNRRSVWVRGVLTTLSAVLAYLTA